MTIEDPVDFWGWLLGGEGQFGALWTALITIPLLALGVLFVAYVSFAAQYGPGSAFGRVRDLVAVAFSDLLALSPRRVFAMSWLAFQQAIRMRALVAFGVFALFILFASWYLDVKTDDPAKLYIGTVFTSAQFLILPLVLLLSAFSLPYDIKNHTIYTVVTKPVRASEIVLGRMLGFTVLGTLILVAMCLISYIFVLRGLAHQHTIEADNEGYAILQEDRSIVDEDGNFGRTGQTTQDDYHRHTVYINPDGSGFTDVKKGHRHRIYNNNGFAQPIANLLAQARLLRKAEKAKNRAALPALEASAYGNTQAQAASLAERARAAAADSSEHREVYEELANALAAANGFAADEDTTQLIASLNDAQNAANDAAISRFVVGPPIGQLQAREAKYGSLSFLNREGLPSDKGVNVGNEWTYRSYIEGGTLAAAIWTFDDIHANDFPATKSEFERGIPLELTLRVFRTHKGDIEKGILGRLEVIESLTPEQIADGDKPLVSEPIIFYAEEFTADRKYVPRTLNARRGGGPLKRDLNLFEDFAHDGRLIVRIRCEDRAQYFGAAQPDVYVWTGNNYFFTNFAKGYVAIWCQMVLVIAFGVLVSTFVSAPVATLAGAMCVVTGRSTRFIASVWRGNMQGDNARDVQPGGGPLESLIRIVQQKNQVTELDDSVASDVIVGVDNVMLTVMRLFSTLMPNFRDFDKAPAFVAGGYDIPTGLMGQQLLTVLTYFVVVAVLGYLILRSREVAA